MARIIVSLSLGLLIGSLVGLALGWMHHPAGTRNRHLAELATSYRDEYSLMIAAGYAAERDIQTALEGLGRMYGDEAPRALRETTERIIQTSARGLEDITLLVQLAAALNQLSETMQPFQDAQGASP